LLKISLNVSFIKNIFIYEKVVKILNIFTKISLKSNEILSKNKVKTYGTFTHMSKSSSILKIRRVTNTVFSHSGMLSLTIVDRVV